MDKTAHDAWIRVGGGRINALLKGIAQLGGMNAPRYKYTNEELAQCFDTLRKALDAAEKALAEKEAPPEFTFESVIVRKPSDAPKPNTTDID